VGARRFGGFGVGVESPRVVVSVRPRSDDAVLVSGSQADRAEIFARRAWSRFGLSGGVEMNVH
jgi:predicted sugar kinase